MMESVNKNKTKSTTTKGKVIVGVSGGVDSAVALYLLKEQGYEVVAVTMEIYKGEALINSLVGGSCYGKEKQDLPEIKAMCESLAIPYYVFDCSEEFAKQIVAYFKDEYLQGRTPNPCILCNQRIKFATLPEKAKKVGLDFDFFATGHYASIKQIKDRYYLACPKDKAKDQTYFLHRLSQEQLAKTIFPLGELTKNKVREIARKIYGALGDKHDSQDFYAGDYKDILQKPDEEGDIVDKNGKILGKHKGFWHYTLGQRKGLGIANPVPLYVSAIDAKNNKLIVGELDTVMKTMVKLVDFSFYPVSDSAIFGKVRSTQKQTEIANIVMDKEAKTATITFIDAFKTPAPAQSLVLYQDDVVVGAGIII